tara:strand:- start:91 stop:612 length:522 start_codon:yes stop_codon:yes gene_type:complete
MSRAFKSNPKASWLIVAAIAALAVTSVLSACQIQDLVRVEVPSGIQAAIGLESKISVSDSEAAWQEWIAWVDRNSSRFSDEIGSGQETAGIIASLTQTGIAIGQDAASTLPGGAFITTGLALMGGLFLKRPGDKAKQKAETQAAFRQGLEKGQGISSTVLAGLQDLKKGQGQD